MLVACIFFKNLNNKSMARYGITHPLALGDAAGDTEKMGSNTSTIVPLKGNFLCILRCWWINFHRYLLKHCYLDISNIDNPVFFLL